MDPSIVSGSSLRNDLDVEDERLLTTLRRRLEEIGDCPLFRTSATGLWETFLENIPSNIRKLYTCYACEHFVGKYGSLAIVEPDGGLGSVLWWDYYGSFAQAFDALNNKIEKSRITGVFFTRKVTLGYPQKGGWRHFSAKAPSSVLPRFLLQSAFQAKGEKTEDYKLLQKSLAEFRIDLAREAVTLLESDTLYRNEKVLGAATWFLNLHTSIAPTKGTKRENLIWLAVAKAPPGFCHIRTTMIGTLFEDLAKGLSFEEVSRRFGEKMHPLRYRRPSTLKPGNVARAEKVVTELASAGALRRRFARLEEIQTVWTPKSIQVVEKVPKGVFSHLLVSRREEEKSLLEIPPQTMTWVKFRDTVLPLATEIQADVIAYDSFIGLVTAADPEAPSILQWDLKEKRNPVSWYVYPGGSPSSRWNLSPGWNKVTGITFLPSAWNGGFEHHGNGVILILDGCRDMNNNESALFPEVLRAEYHEIRSSIEAYSRSGRLEGFEEANACGLDLRKGRKWNASLRVTRQDGQRLVYKLDRWD